MMFYNDPVQIPQRALLLLVLASTARAQFESSSVLGSVRDPQGAPVSGAAVQLRNPDTGVISKTTSNSSGDYQFFPVRIGRYEV